MSSFLNKNKFKNKFKNKSFKVATRVLVFSCFLFLSCNIVNAQDISDPNINPPINVDGDNGSAGSNLNPANWIPNILLSILQLMGWFVKIAANLFNVAINPSLFNEIFVEKGKVLYDMWSFIKDFLNIFFILILLLSAFATVFQVSKYHIMKGNILLWVVLMALLVNFSWPVTRVIIDMSNVTMYFFVDEMLGDSGGTGTTAKLGALSNLSDLMVPNNYDKTIGGSGLDISYILMAIVVMFIFAMTLFAYAGVLLIRVIALTMLLIFSPIGFVAAAFPATSKYATQWWDALFKYAFNGPILVFMLVVAIKMMEAIGKSDIGENNTNLLDIIAKGSTTNFFNEIATSATFFAIPIFILWMALIVAGKTDGASGWAAKKAQGWTKDTGKWAAKYSRKGMATGTDILANQTVGRATRGVGSLMSKSRHERVRKAGDVLKEKKFTPIIAGQGVFQGGVQRSKNMLTKWDKERQGEIAGVKAGTMETLGDKAAMQNLENQQVSEIKKDLKDRNVDFDSMVEQAKTAKGTRLRALTETISSHNQLPYIDSKDYGKIMNQLENDTSKSVKELSKSLTGSLRSKGGGSVIVKNELVKGTDAKIIFEDNFSKIKGKDLAKHGGLFTEKDEETRKHIIGNASKKGTVANELREAMKDSEFKQSFLLNASTAVKKGAVEAGILLDENRISEIKQKTILTPEEDSILRNQEQLNARK